MSSNKNNQKANSQTVIDADFTEVPTNTNEEVNTMNENININTNEAFETALKEAGFTKADFINAFADGIAAGAFSKDDVYEVQRRADYLVKADKKKKRELEKAEMKAKREADRAANGKPTLTTGKKVLIGVGITATVVIIGGVVWWLIQKKRNSDACACDIDDTASASALRARFDRLVTV